MNNFNEKNIVNTNKETEILNNKYDFLSGSNDYLNFYDSVELSEFIYDEENQIYKYPCPCGDEFEISEEDIENNEIVARCPACSLIIRVIY